MYSNSSVFLSFPFKWFKSKIHEATNIERSEFAQKTKLHNLLSHQQNHKKFEVITKKEIRKESARCFYISMLWNILLEEISLSL